MRSPLPDAITTICRANFGTYRGAGRWSPPNRCNSCPLGAPCMAWGAAPAHTQDQLDEALAMFVATATAITTGATP